MAKTVLVYFVAKPEHADEVARAFADFCAESRKEPGCLSYDCFRESEEPANFVFVERWKDDEAPKLHVKSKHMDEVHRRINGKLRRKPRVVRIMSNL
ncbi:hypothetical protein DFJ74DRAFT_684756 [Hyaloraphidium curvatum]|nr:hypothetical protein DFJ74DRAFT_684756 [Hyaloraphidium curvatum]